jgi:hypothetical protein
VPCQCDILVQCELEELVAESVLLVRRKSSPVLDSELPGLNGSQLTEVGPGVSAKDLQEGIKRGGRTVVVLVQSSRGILHNLGVGWAVSDMRGNRARSGQGKLTLQQALEQRDKLLLIHGGAFTVEEM